MTNLNSTYRSVVRIAIFGMPLLVGCSLFGSAISQGSPVSSTPTEALAQPTFAQRSPPSGPDMMTIFTLEKGEIQVPAPPPTTLNDLLNEQIESGHWDEGEGLVMLLGLVAGEVRSAELPDNGEVLEVNPTGLLRRAGLYLDDPEHDVQYEAEIARLIAKLSPHLEQLERISRPIDTLGETTDLTVGRRLQIDVPTECSNLMEQWFSAEIDTGEYCYVYRHENVDGHVIRIYYPKWWQEQPDLIVSVDASQEALARSVEVYDGLGVFTNILDFLVVFNVTQPEDERSRYGAYVPGIAGTDECPIIVLPKAGGKPHDVFRQIIAHEVFHCYQTWNLGGGLADDEWWEEGSAEYFSNVVYPDVNFEYTTFDSYHLQANLRPIFDMNYENFLLFQYLGNRLGDPALIDLLKSLAGRGHAKQQETLGSYPEFDAIFHDFAVATAGPGVLDSDGHREAASPIPLLMDEPIDRKGERTYRVDPFVARRYALQYEKERRFLQEPIESGIERHSAAQLDARQDPLAWSALPPEIRSQCSEGAKYVLVVTSVEDQTDFKVGVNDVEVAKCDPCVLGTWDVEPTSYAQYYEKLFAANGQPIGLQIHGHFYIMFKEGGQMLTRRDQLEVSTSIANQPSLVTTIDGQGSGAYDADGEKMSITNFSSTTNNVSVRIEGVEVPGGLGPSSSTFGLFDGRPDESGQDSGTESVGGPYTCTNKSLTIGFPTYGDVIFLRVDKIIPTPVPTP